MTVQAQEIIEYRGRKYSLLGDPLKPFLANREDIIFDLYTTAHSHGYQGYWKLENNKLYITNLESSNYKYKDIFQTEEPIFADWFSGELKFGFGNFYQDHWWGNYDDYLLLDISKGVVQERSIVKLFCEVPTLDFGKYKNKMFEEILIGKISRDPYTTIKNYIEALIFYICTNDVGCRFQLPDFSFEQEDGNLAKEIRDHGIEYFLTHNYIAFSTKSLWEIRAEKISTLIEKILSSSFLTPVIIARRGLEKADILESTLLINPDLNYLNWAMKTVDSLVVPPSFLNKTFNLKRLKTLNIT